MITAYRLFGWVAAAAAGWWALEGAIRLGWGEGSRSLFAAGAAAVAAATLASCRWRARWWSDADKLDAFHVIMIYYRQYRENPVNFKLGIELPDEPGYSEHVVNELLSDRCVDNRQLKKLNDLKLSLLGWVYDVNFKPTFKRIKKCGYPEELLGFLPADEKIGLVRKKILGYVDFQLAREGK